MTENTQEPQYRRMLELRDAQGCTPLGLMANQMWEDDPRHLLFTLSRYKFVSKMLKGRKRVLEVGCGDAFGTRMVQQEVPSICAVDFDPVFIADAQRRSTGRWKFDCRVHNMLAGPIPESFDAAYSLDVLEHIAKEDEDRFIQNIVDSLSDHGMLIIGMPSLESQQFASPPSKAGHVNCKTQSELTSLLQPIFSHVVAFSMNDEVVHTGFSALAHYLFAVCTGCRPH